MPGFTFSFPSVSFSLHHSMTQAIAEHRFTFIAFDCSVYPLAVFVTHFSANVCRVDRCLLARCEHVMHIPSLPEMQFLRSLLKSESRNGSETRMNGKLAITLRTA